MDAIFHGWGYAHLYRNGSGKLTEVGNAVRDPGEPRRELRARVRRPLDPRVGDRSGPRTSRTPSYYAGGLRVVSFGDNGHPGAGPLHRGPRQQLLGRGAVHDRRAGRAADRGVGSRLRALHLPSTPAPAPPPAAEAAAGRRRRRRRRPTPGEGCGQAADLAAAPAGEPEPAEAAPRARWRSACG